MCIFTHFSPHPDNISRQHVKPLKPLIFWNGGSSTITPNSAVALVLFFAQRRSAHLEAGLETKIVTSD